MKTQGPQDHDIRLYADGHIVEGLTIDEAYNGERDGKNVLVQEGGVLFRTAAGKKLFLHYSEFSFIVNRDRQRAA